MSYKKVVLVIVFFCGIQHINAQLFLETMNWQEIRVDDLSDAELSKIKAELVAKNVDLASLQSLAVSKGMAADEFEKLKSRIGQLQGSESKSADQNADPLKSIAPLKDTEQVQTKAKSSSQVFGSELFTGESMSFEPDTDIAPPTNYILGKGDELQVNVFGVQIFNHTTAVKATGTIDIPNVGEINVNGLSLESASGLIKTKLSRVYQTLKSGQSQVSVTLTKVKTIKVTIIGGSKPGNYVLSSFSTVFNALYACGGPSENGSYRTIELLRNNKVYKTIDIYRFLINGDQSDNLNLKDNDVIKIPTYQNRVTVEGEVKRPGIFELLPGENFDQLLAYCSGFTDFSYKSNIKLVQHTEKELKINDLSLDSFKSYAPKSGDVFKVNRILNRYQNRVTISGAIFRPDEYELSDAMTIRSLINKADGLREDAYAKNAHLIRTKEDLTKEIISIDLRKVLSGDKEADLVLMKEDKLIVFSILDFENEYDVEISGQVKNPGKYEYIKGLSLFDLIIQSGGFNDGASKRVEIARMIKSDEIDLDNIEESKIMNYDLSGNFEDSARKILLEPSDLVKIRKMPVYEIQKNIMISGSVVFPGSYTISNSKETVLDLIKRSGGLKPEADINAIKIKRYEDLLFDRDSSLSKRQINIPINYKKILRKPKSRENIVINPGDEIIISKYSDVVKIIGEINLASEIPYVKGKKVKYYIKAAGGFTPYRSKKHIYLVNSNGYASLTSRILFFNKYPKVSSGCEIIIPKKVEKTNQKSTGEVIAYSSILGSFTGMVLTLINISRK